MNTVSLGGFALGHIPGAEQQLSCGTITRATPLKRIHDFESLNCGFLFATPKAEQPEAWGWCVPTAWQWPQATPVLLHPRLLRQEELPPKARGPPPIALGTVLTPNQVTLGPERYHLPQTDVGMVLSGRTPLQQQQQRSGIDAQAGQEACHLSRKLGPANS